MAKLTLYPPAAWSGTSSSANVSLVIFVNGTEKARTTDVINASHISAGLFTIASF
ncbi:MAG: hypothetical protein ABIW38_01335 [Ferruginibacter sp.]